MNLKVLDCCEGKIPDLLPWPGPANNVALQHGRVSGGAEVELRTNAAPRDERGLVIVGSSTEAVAKPQWEVGWAEDSQTYFYLDRRSGESRGPLSCQGSGGRGGSADSAPRHVET